MITRLVGAYFSPLRDPYFKDWIFYVFLFFTIPSILSNAELGWAWVLTSIPLTLAVNWCIFIFGFSWIRSFGLNKFAIGISPKYRNPNSLNFPVLDERGLKVSYSKFQELINRFALKKGEQMKMFQSEGSKSTLDSPDFKNWIESTFLWDMLFKPGEFQPMIFGPVWFSCSEVKRKVSANLCLMTTGEIGITWRKNTNSLLDYWLTHISEISNFRLINEYTLEIEFRTVNRVIGKASGLRKSEIGVIELRISSDGHANRRSIAAFYSFLGNLN